MKHLEEDDLLGFIRGELSPQATREVEEHTDECPACRRELAWLRTERGLFRATPVVLQEHTWQGVERRIIVAREQRDRRVVRRRQYVAGGGAAAVFAAAAGFLLYVWGRGLPVAQLPASSSPSETQKSSSEDETKDPSSSDRPEATEVLDDAERQYQTAIASLEEAYAGERDQLDPEIADRYDDEISHLREVVREVSTEGEGKDDPWARRRVLRAYSAYMRSMQAMVLEVRK